MNRTPKENPSGRVDGQSIASEGSNSGDQHGARIQRYEKAKDHALSTQKYLASIGAEGSGVNNSPAAIAAGRLLNCANQLVFRDYYTVGKVRLHKGVFCQVHQLCPFCAIRRGAKLLRAYLPVYELLAKENPGWSAWLITLTVKNGDDLAERFEMLSKGHRTLQKRRRTYNERNVGSSVWNAVKGAVGAFEVTNKGQGWHPHIHLVAFLDKPPDLVNGRWLALEAEWHSITGDSYVVDARPFGGGEGAVKSFCEVFKYALKFSELSSADNWHAYRVLKGKRLIFSYGAFRGVEVPEDLTDDDQGYEDLPFVELLYRYVLGKGYGLASMRNSDENLRRLLGRQSDRVSVRKDALYNPALH